MNSENDIDRDLLPAEELQIIRSMIEKTRQTTTDRSGLLLLWGWLVFFAGIASSSMMLTGHEYLAWLPWAVLMPAGAVASVFLIRRYKVRSQHTHYLEHACNSLWFACGCAFFIIALFGSFSPILTYKAISPVCALIAGIGMLSLGKILEWKSLRLAGVIWWISAVLMMFMPHSYQGIVIAATVIPGYLIPGYTIRKRN